MRICIEVVKEEVLRELLALAKVIKKLPAPAENESPPLVWSTPFSAGEQKKCLIFPNLTCNWQVQKISQGEQN